jgi:hypothetical protein
MYNAATVPNLVPEFKKLDIPVLGTAPKDPYPDQPEVLSPACQRQGG